MNAFLNIRKRSPKFWIGLALAIAVLALLGSIQPGSVGGPHTLPRSMQSCYLIARAMTDYARRHGGKYPDGQSSTEVFQKLLDDGEIGNFAQSASIFYLSLPGKIPAPDGAKLRPENVAYDVTSGIDSSSPEHLPIVYLTGFRLDFKSGAGAISTIRPFPYWLGPPAFFGNWWWVFGNIQHNEIDWLTVAYKNGDTYIRSKNRFPDDFTPDGFGIVPNLLPADFDAKGVVYRQLTPEGPLK